MFKKEKFENDLKKNLNLGFFQNEIPADPYQDHYEDILKDWKGNYEKLEYEHNFIQWLFPIHTYSAINMHSQNLQLHELEVNSNRSLIQI